MARDDGLWLLLLLGGGLLLAMTLTRPGSAYARPVTGLPGQIPGAGQEPILYWINPATGELVQAWGVTPPAPGYRPASAMEIAGAQGAM